MESFNMTNDTMSWLLCDTDKNILCVLLYVFLISMMAIIICGNLLVIISIIYFKQLHTPTNYLILSLAVADLLIGVLIFPFSMTFSYINCLSDYSLLCNIRTTCDSVISIASILNLCCISVDRYYAVCYPLMYKMKITDSVAMKMSLGSWAVATTAGLVFFLVFLIQKECDDACNFTLVIMSVITYYTPTIILVCMYCKILSVALSQARSIQNKTKSGVNASKEKKATKTLTIVVGVFLICWAPLILCYPFYPLSSVVFDELLEPLNWFSLSNSMLNPFIYGFFYSWFRAAFRMIISGKIFQGDVTNTKLH